MDNGVCHDLKTERREVSNGLPQVLKIVPILFYLVLTLGTTLIMWFEYGHKNATTESEKWSSEAARLQASNAQIAKEHSDIEAMNDRAQVVAKWIEGSHNLQPLSVAISRSVGEESTIAELHLQRNSEIPSNIKLTLKMDGVTSSVFEKTLASFGTQGFRAYSADQNKNEDSVDYQAILVWQNSEKKTRS